MHSRKEKYPFFYKKNCKITPISKTINDVTQKWLSYI